MWHARGFGLPREGTSAVIQLITVTPKEDAARRALSEHLRVRSSDEWSAAWDAASDDGHFAEGRYIRHHRRSEMLSAAADTIKSGANAVEFEHTRYELFEFKPVETRNEDHS